MIFTDLITDMKAWLKRNFSYLELESIEVNPILFRHINETIQKELISRTIGDAEIRFIDGLRLVKSTDAFSGIHFKLKETIPEWKPEFDEDPAKRKATA